MRTAPPSATRVVTPSRLALAFSMTAPLLLGCSPAGEPIGDVVARCAELPGASSTENPELRRLLAAVREAGGTPTQLSPAAIGEVRDAETNAAATLAKSLNDPLRWKLAGAVADRMDERFAVLDAAQDASQTEHVTTLVRFLDEHQKLCRRLAAAAECPRCVFDPDLRLGYFAGLRFVDDTGLAARIALLEAVRSGLREDTAAAWDGVERALRWAGWLSRVRRVESRVLAATLRAEALATAQRLFRGGTLGRSQAEILYGRLRDDLAAWPDDDRMLSGERAVVMHSYEAIRAGMLDRVLTQDERKLLEEQGRLSSYQNAAPKAIDRDEANYLRAMAELIGPAAAPRSVPARPTPFHSRLSRFDEATALADAPPGLFAGWLFLADLVDALRLTARDRARCEAWCVGLASATDLTMPPYRTNPVTGNDYEVVHDANVVVIRLGDSAVENVMLPVW